MRIPAELNACALERRKQTGAMRILFIDNERLHRIAHAGTLHLGITNNGDGHLLVITESVFSMDGDHAPLREIVQLKDKYGAWLMVDEAHGTGVLGPNRRGLAELLGVSDQIEMQMGTLGKAAGVSGAFVAGDRRVIEWLMQRARPYIFTTASSPVIAVALRVSLELIARGADRRAHLRKLIARLHAGLNG